MTTFKNTVAEKSKSLTTIWFAQGEKAPTDFGKWVECDELELDLSGAQMAFRQDGITYYGSL